MLQPFSNPAGKKLLVSLREDVFKRKKIYHRKDHFIMFVCGGKLGEREGSLRQQFIGWAKDNLPEFVCLIAEEALSDNFAGEGRTFVNLAKFELIIAEVADCVLIFPESPGSYAEAGFFANSTISKKTLVINPLDLQTVDSFLNLGPFDTINAASHLKPTILINVQGQTDFTPVGQRLRERIKWPKNRERLPYQTFGKFNSKQKIMVVFEMLRLLRLADLQTLRRALVTCFGGNPRYQELRHLLRIQLAAKFIQRNGAYFMVTPEVTLVEIEHFETERLFAQIHYFYQKHSKELYEVLAGTTQ